MRKKIVLVLLLCGLLCNAFSVSSYADEEKNTGNVFKKGGAILAISSGVSASRYYQKADTSRIVNGIGEAGAGITPDSLLISATGQDPSDFFENGFTWIDPNIGRGYISVPVTQPSVTTPNNTLPNGTSSNGTLSNGGSDSDSGGDNKNISFGPNYNPFVTEPDDSKSILDNISSGSITPDFQTAALLYRSIFANSATRIKMSYYDESGMKTSIWFYLGLLGTKQNLNSIANGGQLSDTKNGTLGGNEIYGNLFETSNDGILEDAYIMISKLLGSNNRNNTLLYDSNLVDIDSIESLSDYLSRNSSTYIEELQRRVEDYEGCREEWIKYTIFEEKKAALSDFEANNHSAYSKYRAPTAPSIDGLSEEEAEKALEEYRSEYSEWKKGNPEAAHALSQDLERNRQRYEELVASYDETDHYNSLCEQFDSFNTSGENIGEYPAYLAAKASVEMIEDKDDEIAWFNWVTRGTTEVDPNDKSTWSCPEDAAAFREWLIKRDLYEGDYNGYSMDMDIYTNESEGGTVLSLWESVYNNGKNRVTGDSYPYLYSYTDATNASFREGGSNFDRMILLQHKLGLDTGRNGKRLDLKYYKDICVQDYKNTKHSEAVPIQRYEWYVYYSPGRASDKDNAEIVFHSATTQKECPFTPNVSGTYWVDCYQSYRVKYYETLEYTESSFLVDETTKSVLMASQNQNGTPLTKTINEKEVIEKVNVLSGVQAHYMEAGSSEFKVDNGIVSASYSTERILN